MYTPRIKASLPVLPAFPVWGSLAESRFLKVFPTDSKFIREIDAFLPFLQTEGS
jgi:hypothetical protein